MNRKILLATTAALSIFGYNAALAQAPSAPPPAAQPQLVSTPCSPAANPAKAGAGDAKIQVLRPADGASVNDWGNVRLYMPIADALLDNDGKIVQIFACPDGVGYRMKPVGEADGFLVFEVPVKASQGMTQIVACNATSKNCFKGDGKAGDAVKVVKYDRPTK